MSYQSQVAKEPAVGISRAVVLLFDYRNRLFVRTENGADEVTMGPMEIGKEDAGAVERRLCDKIESETGRPGLLRRVFSVGGDDRVTGVWFGRLEENEPALDPGRWRAIRLEALMQRCEEQPEAVSDGLVSLLPEVVRNAEEIPYLNFKTHDFVYKFRAKSQHDPSIYIRDEKGRDLYRSALCEVIKETRRIKENSSAEPAVVDFGPVQYVLPSHFGFCLGVQNAIERAYETLERNPGKRVFMLSELIHNPYVNDDLMERGLVYLQTDKGKPLQNPRSGRLYWDELDSEDIVLIPAFGATNEDKRRLILKGIPLNRYDATCMLVEKVWKAAKRYGQKGYTVIIHGKAEHEETKATFSNSARYAPSLVIRNLEEAEKLAEVILSDNRADKERLFQEMTVVHSAGFDVERDLARLAVVNQTTLLRNETLTIIRRFEEVMIKKFGPAARHERINGNGGVGDTLCYATQVNQDALERALAMDLDCGMVAGGKNSSNTFQLYRLCERLLCERAFYIQSERNILSRDRIEHYVFPFSADVAHPGGNVLKSFLPEKAPGDPVRILLTGGASCPDGIIQQIISRINSFWPSEILRPVEAVLQELRSSV